MKKIILASGSPRRKALLEKAGISFTVDVSDFEEYMDMSITPEELVKALSLGKATKVAQRHANAIVIAADTFVVLGKEYLGKPKDRKHAAAMLRNFSDTTHKVVTGFTVFDTITKQHITDVVDTYITFHPLTDEMINSYLDKGTYSDKAGGYAIQEVGPSFIKEITGDIDSAIGLPITHVLTALEDL
jgi:septum formation protein